MYATIDMMTADKVKKLMQPLLDKGCFYDYFYEKGGDSSCVYICRFKRGKDYFDWREVSGAEEVHLVAYVKGEFTFPNLKTMYKKEHRKFWFKHIFRKATMDEKREFVAKLLLAELDSGKPDFFGLKFEE
ncbi:MAG: hypothetical protein E7371_01265 [Clostridiales bacterium]|jgi:hypothetical protein|nr:hypothetical protein [Clostridiales bacterium]